MLVHDMDDGGGVEERNEKDVRWMEGYTRLKLNQGIITDYLSNGKYIEDMVKDDMLEMARDGGRGVGEHVGITQDRSKTTYSSNKLYSSTYHLP